MKLVVNLFLFGILFFTSCSKNEDVITPTKPVPVPVDNAGIFQLELSLPEHHAEDSLDVFITLVNQKGQAVWQNQVLRIGKTNPDSYQWKSAVAKVEKERYTMTQLVVKKANKALYATPLAGSRLFSSIQVGLPQQHPISEAVSIFKPQVIAVDELVAPVDFGYAASLFPRNGHLLAVSTQLRVGELVYEVPVLTLDLITTLASGEKVSRRIERASVEEEIRLNEKAVSYEISTSLWNVPVKKSFSRQELLDNEVIRLEAEKNRKWLSVEQTYLEVMGQWRKESETVYTMRADGQLGSVTYYQKKPQSAELQYIFSDFGVYSGNQLTGVKRYDPAQKLIGQTQYEYAANGKITHINTSSYDQTTTSVIEEAASTEGLVTDVYMLFDNGHALQYAATFSGGNKISYRAQSSTGASEGGSFQYDQHINPRATNKLFPDMYLTNVSKNNLTGRNAGYAGAVPTSIPYKYEYVYNADGYPEILYTYFKSYTNNQDLFRKKTVFTYSN